MFPLRQFREEKSIFLLHIKKHITTYNENDARKIDRLQPSPPGENRPEQIRATGGGASFAPGIFFSAKAHEAYFGSVLATLVKSFHFPPSPFLLPSRALLHRPYIHRHT